MKLVCTCKACPEQYVVLDDKNVPVGYIQFRFGQFGVYPIKIKYIVDWTNPLLEKVVNDDLLGAIPDNVKSEWLNEAINILENYETNI